MAQVDTVGETEADLAFLEALRRMRAQFHSEIAAASRSRDPGVVSALDQDSFYQLAEFFYAIKTHGIDDAEKLGRFARLHNEHLVRIGEDRDRMRRYGLTPQRIASAQFNHEKLAKLLANFSGSRPGIDQSDLARLLATVMSTETCRKMVVAAEEAGFVERLRSPFGPVLVVSQGTMESIYGKVLRETRHAVENA